MSDTLHIITCSYGPDLERCERLCKSVDRYVEAGINHTLIVPARDQETFAFLASSRRQVRSSESVLPGTYRQIPGQSRWWFDDKGWPVRGCVLHQMSKLCADRVTTAENLLFVDSDVQFIRPFDESEVLRDGQLRLHRIPGANSNRSHSAWHRRAGKLLGTPRAYLGADYAGQLITWRREHLLGMKSRIECVTGKPWHHVFGRSLRVSEYILYGIYVDHVLPAIDRVHYSCHQDLCHCCRFAEEAKALAQGADRIGAGSVALLLQSNIGLNTEQEAEILDFALENIQTT